MAEAKTADGAVLHWEERGVPDGPLLVGSMHFNAPPSVFEGLWADLARDHRVVTYDLRGVGGSPWEGPYDIETDAADLVTVVEAAGDAAATVVAFGDGTNRAVRAAAAHPDLVGSVVGPAGNPLGRRAAEGGSGLASSTGVLQLLQEQMRRDYRAALREMIASANPDWDDDVIRERIEMTVEYCPQDAAAERLTNWIEDDALELSRALGDRLWIIAHGQNPWFPRELAERTRELAPEAHVVELDDGPVTRPDLHAAVVREAVAQKARSVG